MPRNGKDLPVTHNNLQNKTTKKANKHIKICWKSLTGKFKLKQNELPLHKVVSKDVDKLELSFITDSSILKSNIYIYHTS